MKTFGKTLLFLPILVFPLITALEPIWVPESIMTFGPIIAPPVSYTHLTLPTTSMV